MLKEKRKESLDTVSAYGKASGAVWPFLLRKSLIICQRPKVKFSDNTREKAMCLAKMMMVGD